MTRSHFQQKVENPIFGVLIFDGELLHLARFCIVNDGSINFIFTLLQCYAVCSIRYKNDFGKKYFIEYKTI